MLEVDLSEAAIEEVIAETIVESDAIMGAIEKAIEEVIEGPRGTITPSKSSTELGTTSVGPFRPAL